MCVARNAPMGEELDRAWLGKDRERRRRAGQARIIHRALGGTGSGAGEMAAHNFRNSGVPDFHSPGSAFPQIRIPELVAKEKKEELLDHLVNLLQAWHAERVNDAKRKGEWIRTLEKNWTPSRERKKSSRKRRSVRRKPFGRQNPCKRNGRSGRHFLRIAGFPKKRNGCQNEAILFVL